MPSGVRLRLRVLPPLPDGFIADPKNPKFWRRMDKARCASPTGRRNYSEGSPPLCSSNCLPPPTALSARYKPSLRYAILGAGFAGLSVAWHLLKVAVVSFYFLASDSVVFIVVSEEFSLASEQSSEDSRICIDIYDDAGVGGGASGASGGLLHPYSPKERRKPELRVALLKIHFVASKKELSGKVVICLGAKVDKLPQLSGKLPLRTCRGVIAKLQLPSDLPYESLLPSTFLVLTVKIFFSLKLLMQCLLGESSCRGEYDHQRPSILSDAWLAFREPRSVLVGSTWDWNSKDYASSVSEEEASSAMEELMPKASSVYPPIRNWAFVGAQAGLRAMPPLTPYGSLPLLGCVDDIIGENVKCRYWLVGGLGSRGLLYHGLVGKLTAQAVLSSNESVLPSEFTHWKSISK
ncbi:hypothetical protein GW17_00034087 [Ensete ventricosum]|nr:hypothetical protein GW17_00034087 [Ensete ventricosum]